MSLRSASHCLHSESMGARWNWYVHVIATGKKERSPPSLGDAKFRSIQDLCVGMVSQGFKSLKNCIAKETISLDEDFWYVFHHNYFRPEVLDEYKEMPIQMIPWIIYELAASVPERSIPRKPLTRWARCHTVDRTGLNSKCIRQFGARGRREICADAVCMRMIAIERCDGVWVTVNPT